MIKETDKKEKELLDIISDLEFKIKKLKDHKRYGLVWENKIEKFDKESKDTLPVLREKGDKYPDIITDKNDDFNILIEGDNYHSLSILSYTHKNKIDIIYIDPPYNTGKKDFIYNDHFVDIEDRFRHSKWLSFMSKRLRLAKTLLKKDGVIFISIDDNEIAQLTLLCDEIFGEKNFINNFMWLHGKGKKTKQSRTLQQYILCYAKNKQLLNEWIDTKFASGTFSNPDNDPRGDWFSGSVSFSEERSNKQSENYFTIKSPTGISWTRQWQCTKEEMDEYLVGKKIYFGLAPEYSNVPRLKIFPDDTNEIIPSNIIEDVGSTRDAQNELDEIIGKKEDGKSKFENPKPIKLIQFLCNITNTGKNITVLDFFAGSGTTGQAVLDLNKDGGSRKFILCTNNGDEKSEHKIATDICYPRIQKVMRGYTNIKKEKIEKIGGNLKYLKTDFVKLEKSIDALKHKIVEGSTEILCLKEGTFNSVLDIYKKNRIKIFENKDKYTAILFDLFYFDNFVEQLKKLKNKPVSVYVFSYTKDFLKKEFGDLDVKFTIEPIPEKILETYKKIFNF